MSSPMSTSGNSIPSPTAAAPVGDDLPSTGLDPRITERRNPRTEHIDLASSADIVALMLAEDRTVADAVATQTAQIARIIDAVEGAFRGTGRLLYVGAGTSGRLGVLDASECPPTFGSDPARVVGIIAGGDRALRHAVEGAEDSPDDGAAAVDAHVITEHDVVVGIAASGTTPFVRGALTRARACGATTALVACSPPPEAMLAVVDIAVVAITGPEVLTGSTRLKAGTATKLILNMITTGAFIRIGKSYGNLMVDLRATNAKLADRSERMVMEVCGIDRVAARTVLAAAGGSVKVAIIMQRLGVAPNDAQRLLDANGGVIRTVLPDALLG
jgi:N-acetylmuramic acid 6-phosphate etherase